MAAEDFPLSAERSETSYLERKMKIAIPKFFVDGDSDTFSIFY
jgi:hypothetical protein